LRQANLRRVSRELARQPVATTDVVRAHTGNAVYGAPRTLLFITVKRNNTSWRKLYGHWWVEVDSERGYGWWPATVPLRALDLLRGAPGVLNGVGLLGLGGSWERDPHHGQVAVHAFHPVLVEGVSDDEVRRRLEEFAHGYRTRWRWHWSAGRSSGTCRAFQDELLAAAGLREAGEQLHTRGSGCPFLYQPRRLWWWALDLDEQRLCPESRPSTDAATKAQRRALTPRGRRTRAGAGDCGWRCGPSSPGSCHRG
jgi:hypothetical protein